MIMTMSRLTKIAVQTTLFGMLFVGFASLAIGQQAKGPPTTTRGTVKSAPKAEKGQQTAEAKRVEAGDRKDAKEVETLDNKEQRTALKTARGEPKALLKGIALTKTQKTTVKAIEERYTGELKTLEKQARSGEKAGQADPAVVARIEELRRRERAEIRGTLTAQEQARFDRNVSAYGTKKP